MQNRGVEQSARWLAQAKEDLKWADYLAEAGGYHIACFLAQQVGEKAIKAFLYAQGMEIVLGHSIGRLATDAARYHGDFQNMTRKWSILDTYYIPTRYPNGLPDGIPADAYNSEAARGALSLASEIVAYVEGLLSSPGKIRS